MSVIGITGGTGAGKTTALEVLRRRGYRIIDCDIVYHDLLDTSEELLSKIEKEFPGTVIDGVLNRKKLGAAVFSDSAALERLSEITDKAVYAKVEELKTENTAIDAIRLFESGLADICDITVFVTAPASVRARRIMERESISEEYAMLRINAQKPDSYFEERCKYTINNVYNTLQEFTEHCEEFFDNILGGSNMAEIREDLFYQQKNGYDLIGTEERIALEDYNDSYKAYLNVSRTEREAVKEAISLAESKGFVPFTAGMDIKPGMKIYRSNRGKALTLAVIGTKPLEQGCTIAAAHVDAPRLDLKPLPLYEDGEMVYFKTHYYGGIKKYQWVTIPLEIHGVVILKNGEKVDVVIGRDPEDPELVITDLLPHLAADQMQRKGSELIPGENLNLLIGSIPYADEGKDRVKLAIISILNEKYGITEEDFLSAELEVVPGFETRDVGLDRSLIGGYGHDDRVCAYAELKAILDIDAPETTAVCLLVDKEEIGSAGTSGMRSEDFDCFMQDLCAAQGAVLRHCYANSLCISADVCNAFDPNFREVSEVRNNAKINYGLGICKYTGARGKSGCNDADAETVGIVRKVFADNSVVWQMAELGKVDQGGGGTVAAFMAERNISTIDAGVPVLSMHAPLEVVSKFDCYMTYKGMKAVYSK